MRWGRIEEFRSLFSDESRPSAGTVRAWILDSGVTTVIGKRIGHNWYIDLDHFKNTTGDELADEILSALA